MDKCAIIVNHVVPLNLISSDTSDLRGNNQILKINLLLITFFKIYQIELPIQWKTESKQKLRCYYYYQEQMNIWKIEMISSNERSSEPQLGQQSAWLWASLPPPPGTWEPVGWAACVCLLSQQTCGRCLAHFLHSSAGSASFSAAIHFHYLQKICWFRGDVLFVSFTSFPLQGERFGWYELYLALSAIIRWQITTVTNVCSIQAFISAVPHSSSLVRFITALCVCVGIELQTG